ncbi:porin [Hyphomonas pacifica]|uniref:Porin domain-containing protein n=1 Tax=Hyphomonas pacifica TaxID=1280941 RepID=A0A062TYN7_9PROT|nr:porin [Hyphomonas pacifica]KCZ51137.1 hypothetical protein HY2_12435 [Hyphomonas pacifica]RAN33596.1 hypothetical protein HY3_12535 [Hyphomonas pacifica]
MRYALICLALSPALAPIASAQWEDDWQVWETKTEIGTTLLGATHADEPVLYRFWLDTSRNRILDNGVEIGAAGRLEVQRDHPARAGFSGVPNGTEGSGFGLQGAFTGLATGIPAENEDARLQLEQAYVYANGGYGELRLGRDAGVALRFREGSPSIFNTVAIGAQTLDPSGTDVITTRHDLTGPSAKLTYTTPRLIGFRAGLSFTPRVAVRGMDRDADRNLPSTAPVTLKNAAEGAVNFSHLLRQSGVRVRASVAASTAEVDVPAYAAASYDRVSTWSLGGSLEYQDFSFGASYLNSDNGMASQGDYDAWTLGLTRKVGNYLLGAEYGEGEDNLTNLDGKVWSVGVAREFGDHVKGSLGYRETDLDFVPIPASAGVQTGNSLDGIVIEITLSN